MLDGDSDQIISAQLIGSQLHSFVSGSASICAGAGRGGGALSGDVWILMWAACGGGATRGLRPPSHVVIPVSSNAHGVKVQTVASKEESPSCLHCFRLGRKKLRSRGVVLCRTSGLLRLCGLPAG